MISINILLYLLESSLLLSLKDDDGLFKSEIDLLFLFSFFHRTTNFV